MLSKNEYVKDDITSMNLETGKIVLRVEFEGESQMPFWNDDLKAKAILALLNSMDYKNYAESNMHNQANEDLKDIIETANAALGFGVD